MKDFQEQEDKSSYRETGNLKLLSHWLSKPIVIIGVFALIFLIVVSSVFSIQRLVNAGNLTGLVPTPTTIPGSNQFYFSVAPSWSTITVDGHKLSPIPEPGTNLSPLRLSVGVHQLIWQAEPWTPVHCQIFIPFRLSVQGCISSNNIVTFQNRNSRPITANVINFFHSINDLPVNQSNAIYQSAQNLLGQLQGKDLVQPGEHYFFTSSQGNVDSSSRTITAKNVLQAKEYFQLGFSSSQGAYGLCIAGGLIDQPDNCTNQGQSCLSLCLLTVPETTASIDQWLVLAPLNVLWDYKTMNGQIISQAQSDPGNANAPYLVALSIQWSGSHWQIGFFHSKAVDASAIANPVCDAAQYAVGQDSRFLSVVGTSQNIYWKYISGSNSASGCVAEAFIETTAGSTSVTSIKPVAVCLYRFGVLLALDNLAHRSWPFLLQASTYEQGVAQQIVNQH